MHTPMAAVTQMADAQQSAAGDAQAAHRLFVRATASDRDDAGKGSACKGASKADSRFPPGCAWIGADPPETRQAMSGGCPVIGSAAVNPDNQMPDMSQSQDLPGNLQSKRQASSIPIGADSLPGHQPGGAVVWQYPSEQMFFNAMKRKGWDAKEEDMPAIVAIHNGVNERAWHQVCQYEALHSGCTPRLKRFRGRPQDYSPKARLLNMLGYKLPFDRHDWIVDRCGREVRYIIDFYNAAPLPDMPVAMHLDARPALDSADALIDRLRMQWRFVTSSR